MSDLEGQGREVISHMIKHLVTSAKASLGREILEETLTENGRYKDGGGSVLSNPTETDDIGNEVPIFKDRAKIPALDASGQAVLRTMLQNLVQGVALSLERGNMETMVQTTDTVLHGDDGNQAVHPTLPCNLMPNDSTSLAQIDAANPNPRNIITSINSDAIKRSNRDANNPFHSDAANPSPIDATIPTPSDTTNMFPINVFNDDTLAHDIEATGRASENAMKLSDVTKPTNDDVFKDGAVIYDIDTNGRTAIRAMVVNMIHEVARKLEAQNRADGNTEHQKVTELPACTPVIKEYIKERSSREIALDINSVKTNANDEICTSHIKDVKVEICGSKTSHESSVFNSKGSEISVFKARDSEIVVFNSKESEIPVFKARDSGIVVFNDDNKSEVHVFKNNKKQQKGFRLGNWFSGLFSCCGSQKTDD
ncbi:uncharacterized protein LOC128227939 [Mya arenaria]|nr:uncharacterized protein LOC128227939 [Mya arenaria]